MKRRSTLAALAAIASLPAMPYVRAQGSAYPTRAVTMIVPTAPGGTTDIVARVVADALTRELGQPLVISNRNGANGVIGTTAIARAAPDGYTLGFSAPTWFGINEVLNPGTIPYDSGRDFTLIGLVARTKYVLVVPASSKVQSLKDLTALGKSRPDGLTYGNSAIGATPHLATEAYLQQEGINGLRVDYQGSAQMMVALLRGDIDFIFSSVATAVPQIEGGKIRAIAVASNARAKHLPDVPTTAEAGSKALDMTAWFGVFAPRGLPADIVNRINAVLVKELAKPEEQKKLIAAGYEVETSTPEGFVAIRRQEVERARLVIANMKR